MNYKKLILLSLGLTFSTFASAEKSVNTPLASAGKSAVNAQSTRVETSAEKERRCPRPEEFEYLDDGANIWHAHVNEGNRHYEVWGTDTTYAYQKNPTIKFLGVRVLTENGEGDPQNATSYLTCTYKINNWQEIITMRAHHIAYYASVRNQSAWQYIPHQTGKRIGEWRCNKGVDECTFILSREEEAHP